MSALNIAALAGGSPSTTDNTDVVLTLASAPAFANTQVRNLSMRGQLLCHGVVVCCLPLRLCAIWAIGLFSIALHLILTFSGNLVRAEAF